MKRKSLIDRVYRCCDSHFKEGRKVVVDHFLKENHPRASIYRYISMWEKGKSKLRVVGSGRKAKIMTKTNIAKLKSMIDGRSGISTRQIARKLKCSQSHVVYTIQQHTNIVYRKKQTIPARTPEQVLKLQTCCGRLCRKFYGCDFIIDDESISHSDFTFSHSDKNSNVGYWSSNPKAVSCGVKYKSKAKFEKKMLVWLAISSRGISTPYFVPSGLVVKQNVYLKECIIKRLMPFIKKHHPEGNFVFWSDLASAHYAKSVTSYLISKNITFVQKADNPPAVPELHLVENFWSYLKGMVYKNNWQATSVDELKQLIKYCLKKVDVDAVQNMCGGVYPKA